MRRGLIVWIAMSVACTVAPDDEATSAADESSTDAPSTSSASTDPTGDPSTGDPSTGDPTTSDPSAGDPTGDPTGDSSSTGVSTTGDACEVDPADFTEVEGCAEPIGEAFCSEGQQHVEQGTEVAWMSDPPHSGPHYPTWETWGEHDTVVPRGNWVHNLEHGGIVLTYRCNDDCPDELEVLRAVVAMRPDLRILLTNDPMLPGDERFAAISWTWIHRTDAPDLAALLCFADQHENHAPEDVP